MRQMITTRHKLVTQIVAEAERKMNVEQTKQEQINENWRLLRDKGFGYSKVGMVPAILNYDKGRMLYDVMPDKSWKGQRCFIIGGGESLKDFDFSKLKNEYVIGVNRAYEAVDCTINFAMDHNLHEWITKGKLGQEAKRKFEDFKGFPVWLDSVGYDYPQGIFILSKSNAFTVNRSMKVGITGGTNAGFGALNIAVSLGANPIYLLGYDMKGRDGRQAWWHAGYPANQTDKIYKSFINDFKRIAPKLEEKGIEVVNLNPESELKCFKFGRFKDIKPIKRPIIVSYYTKDTGYEEQVEHLKHTLRRFNLANDVVGIQNQGDWHKNTYYKPKFIMEMMKKYPDRPIVFVDADARIRNNPVLFNDLDCDFACYFHHRKELLSGTLYFGNTEGSRYIMNEWLEEDAKHPKTHMPQKNLRAVFDRVKNKINWRELPVEYCMIFDSRLRHSVNPVIEHYQLSRKYKGMRDIQKGVLSNQSLDKIQKFCKGKNICLIGNADSVLRKKKDIDSFDVVCRMNRGKPEGKEEYLGSRTDIHFLSTSMSRKNIQHAFSPRFIVWMTICNRLAHPWVMANAIQNPPEDWKALQKALRINPTTGFLALNFVLKHIDFKSLTIYGFDFFKTKTWYNTKIDSGQKHSGEKEKVLVMNMIKGRKNVSLL